MSWLKRLKAGLSKSSQKISAGFGALLGKRKLDPEWLQEIEDDLIMADLGPAAAGHLVQVLKSRKFGQEIDQEELRHIFAEELSALLKPVEKTLEMHHHRPHVVLMVGVNGSGKTTTIGKLAQSYRQQGKKVLMAAGDTFRAAAIEQLQIWADRTQVPIVTKQEGSDPAGLAFDALTKAREENFDLLLIDSAGRLHNRADLMEELAKIIRVLKKIDPTAPHDCLLVLDATIGQNALAQTETFIRMANVTGLIVTKLDGTAKGGIVVALAEKFKLPIYAIGVGESAEDLQPFHALDFSRSLMGLENASEGD